jgi:hypothetical protein
MRVNVNIPTDFSAGCLSHFLWLPPAVPTPTPTISVEMIATQLWTAGFFLNQEKWTNQSKPVLHKGMWICLDGHDVGILIPDITIPFVNAQYAIMWPTSSRKIQFSASTVQMCGANVACAQLVGLPPLPMMTCGDPISAPVAFSFITFTNTVIVGMTFWDLFLGLAAAAISMVLDFLIFRWFPPGAESSMLTGILKGLGGKYIPFLDKGETLKRGIGFVTDFGMSLLRGNPTFKISVGGPLAGAEVEVAPPQQPGQSWATGRANVGGQQWVTQGSSTNWGTPRP